MSTRVIPGSIVWGDSPREDGAPPMASIVRAGQLSQAARRVCNPNRLIVNTFRRLTASFCTLLLLQLTLLGSGTLCAMRGGVAANGTHDMSAMGGMATSGSRAATSGAGVRAGDPSDVPPTSGNSDDGCRMPWAPGQCTSMTACTVAALPSATLVASLDARPEVPDLPMPGDLGSRPATPPELPPPRA